MFHTSIGPTTEKWANWVLIKSTLNKLQIGAEIFKRALSYPVKLIAKNAGVNGSVVVEKVCPYMISLCHLWFFMISLCHLWFFIQISELPYWDFLILQILSNDNIMFGYNAAKDRYEDLMKAGVMDPSKVFIAIKWKLELKGNFCIVLKKIPLILST